MKSRDNEKQRVLHELLQTALDLSQHGLLSKSDMVAIRGMCEIPPAYTPERVIAIRTGQAKMSQSVFASLLNVSVSTVQKWESAKSGKRPSGAAAKLLQLLERKGVAALMVADAR
ncbi:helix-turn-helix domain-containing protein [Rugamonas apoptosis]|uniref:Helix-turn-helix domain-containing protein n=1 Tax=Rugamonas apoptosis TaxID=2758570 RepID=A0A7W2IJ81_9BURK|nr:helix-turn-helix domain-containing protein [Rugamonas apoptosis]MBA5686283.1 helix-turn-helix domain-containing protein [Rugamonas apoptosis]